ncbi:MAG: DUF1493 family protein [Bacteroidales bacterium]|nr:DUF1493 family protein [Bacteroidales bacterium]
MTKKCLLLSVLVLLIMTSCQQKNDSVVAEIHGHKLYRSEIEELIPDYLSEKDSIDYSKQIIEDWTIRQLLLSEAEKELTLSERNFSKEIEDLHNDLMVQAYCKKITADTSLFPVSEQEIHDFLKEYGKNYTVEKEIVRLNYVKLPKKSKLIPRIQAILSDEVSRQTEKQVIETLCGDSIEYFIEDDKWLYLEDIEFEFPLQIDEKEKLRNENRFIEVEDASYSYLIVLLDYRTRQTAAESGIQNHENARNLIRQQKRNDFIKQRIAELLQKEQKF